MELDVSLLPTRAGLDAGAFVVLGMNNRAGAETHYGLLLETPPNSDSLFVRLTPESEVRGGYDNEEYPAIKSRSLIANNTMFVLPSATLVPSLQREHIVPGRLNEGLRAGYLGFFGERAILAVGSGRSVLIVDVRSGELLTSGLPTAQVSETLWFTGWSVTVQREDERVEVLRFPYV